MKKRIFSFAVVLCIIFGMSVVPTHAASSGSCGTNVSWTLDSGTLTISGIGDMEGYSMGGSPWYASKQIKSVVIQDSVTSIGGYAFYGCSNLTDITISDSVTSIGAAAFYNCSNLIDITIPDSVTSIGGNAFYNTAWYNNQPDGLVYAGKVAYKYKGTMPSDTSIALKDDTKGIAGSAFSICSNLTSITIPDSVTSIGEYAFFRCVSLTSITIPDSVTSIDGYAFDNTAWYNNQPVGLVYAGKVAYKYKGTMPSDTSIALKDDTKGIAGSAFRGCSSLTSIAIPDSVTSIGGYAFYGCSSLTSITIPDSVASIGEYAFYNCSSLTNITITDGVTNMGNNAFYNCSSLTSITIPDSVTSIGNNAFSFCSNLKSVMIGSGLENIESSVFSGCSNITEITIPFIGRSKQASDAEHTFGYIFGTSSYDGSYSVMQRYSTSNSATFYLPRTLKKVTVTNETSVPYGAFNNCTNIYEIDIKDGTSAIENYAFSGCDLLKKISVPSSVETIAQYAFSNSSNIVLYGNENAYIATFAAINNIPFVKTNIGGAEENGFDAVLNKIGDHIIVTANVPDDDITKNIHAALYSNDGELLDYMVYPAEYSNNTVHFMFKNMSDLSYMKVFLWNGFEAMMPLGESIILNVSE